MSDRENDRWAAASHDDDGDSNPKSRSNNYTSKAEPVTLDTSHHHPPRQQDPPVVDSRPPSESKQRISDSSGTSIIIFHPKEPSQSVSTPSPLSPETSGPGGPILALPSNNSSALRKEERLVRGSWTDRSSYMSGENRPYSIPRMDKRAIHDDESPSVANEGALSMIFRLSVFVPIISLFAALYTIFALILAILIFPLRLCSWTPFSPPSSSSSSPSLTAQLCELLAPALHTHERVVYARKPGRSTPSTQTVYRRHSCTSTSLGDLSPGGLLLVLLLSAFLCIPLVLATWTTACFWVFAAVLGNPDGTERRDDGQTAVLGVGKWWQRWLSKARKLPG